MATQLAPPLDAHATTTSVVLHANDPVSRAGIASSLSDRRLSMVDDHDADVAVVVCDQVDDATLRRIRRARRGGETGVVLVVTAMDDEGLYAAVEAGTGSLMRRADASPKRLVDAVVDVGDGKANMPRDLLARLLSQVSQLYDQVLEPRGLHLHGLTDRECSVLRLVARGLTTAEVADELAYSERTIKNVLQGVTTRLGLRNRAHAVAYAVRHGLV